MKYAKYDEDIPDGHPAQSRSDWFPLDQRLRRAGFRIAARPKRGEPIWERRGETYTQSEALATLPVVPEAALARMVR